MTDIILVEPVDAEAELDRLAARYKAAGGPAVQLLNALGGQAENLLDKLPSTVRANLNEATADALRVAMAAANRTRKAVPDQKPWVKTAVATSLGAAGGFGGLPAALVELPVTTTLLLRAIQDVARAQGFDPASENVQFDCVRVFSAAGPLSMDDGADLGFFGVRMALTGGTMQRMIAAVAPRLGVVLGQKLAAQTVPVLGAVAGATTNYVYSSYYQEIAQVHFGLRRLSIDADIPRQDLIARLQERMQISA